MSADSPRHSSASGSRSFEVPATVPPQIVSDRSILDSAIGFINDVALANQPVTDPKDTITWARFECSADISDLRFGEDWELEGNVAPPLLLILGYGVGVQVWAIPANGEAVEVLSWRHGVVSALRVLPTPASSATMDDSRADEPMDTYAEKRPLIALVDGSNATGSQHQFCSVNFISLKTGGQVKAIKFKSSVVDILANRHSIVITFNERIAVFDARTLEDRLSITTCYPSPGINPNPVALGARWLAYAEHKLINSKRSGGGCDGDGVTSYTATVLNAAKSFGKGLRELGEQVAAGLTGSTGSVASSKNNSFDSGSGSEAKQPGVVTIMDIKYPVKDFSPTSSAPGSHHVGNDAVVSHFIAHSEAIVAMEFDHSGLLLLTADRRGHDFHVFSIQPHPVGPSLAAVHHLYVLHRGDTSAKVQNITFSLDSRWVAVSSLRGTTHVFPITPYGGPMGVRTHTSLHVVNKLSRFHRSAGLSAEGRSSSPISHSESTTFTQSLQPYHNPTLPPYPRPLIVLALAQLRQPFTLGSPPGSSTMAPGGGGGGSGGNSSALSQRQRLSSLSDESGKPLSVCAMFAKSRSWLLDPPNATRDMHRVQRKAIDSLFVMAGHGALIQYDLNVRLASNIAKEKICDDTPIELEVEAKAQWNLGRRKERFHETVPPLPANNWLMRDRSSSILCDSTRQFDDTDERAESWLSKVEIITHAGPHRRLWMGPQFVFKTYNTPSGSNLSHVDAEAVEIGVSNSASGGVHTERSSPLNMPGRSAVPVLIESGSYSSIEQSPKFMDRFRHDHLDSDLAVTQGDNRLKEDLADAMRDIPTTTGAPINSGPSPSDGGASVSTSDNNCFYDAVADHDFDDQGQGYTTRISSSSAAALASALPNIYSYEQPMPGQDAFKNRNKISIEKVVNPQGTVTTVHMGMTTEVRTNILDEVVSQLTDDENVIHENCDEALFRPVVAIFCDKRTEEQQREQEERDSELCKPPEVIGNKLVVPVIVKEVDAEMSKREKQKIANKKKQHQQHQQQQQHLQHQPQHQYAEREKEPVEMFEVVVHESHFDKSPKMRAAISYSERTEKIIETPKAVAIKDISLVDESRESEDDKEKETIVSDAKAMPTEYRKQAVKPSTSKGKSSESQSSADEDVPVEIERRVSKKGKKDKMNSSIIVEKAVASGPESDHSKSDKENTTPLAATMSTMSTDDDSDVVDYTVSTNPFIEPRPAKRKDKNEARKSSERAKAAMSDEKEIKKSKSKENVMKTSSSSSTTDRIDLPEEKVESPQESMVEPVEVKVGPWPLQNSPKGKKGAGGNKKTKSDKDTDSEEIEIVEDKEKCEKGDKQLPERNSENSPKKTKPPGSLPLSPAETKIKEVVNSDDAAKKEKGGKKSGRSSKASSTESLTVESECKVSSAKRTSGDTQTSIWKTYSDSEKDLNISEDHYPSLSKPSKGKDSAMGKKKLDMINDFPSLKSMEESLPPLPDLEPLESLEGSVYGRRKPLAFGNAARESTGAVDQVSLINFESPLQENSLIKKKCDPLPRGLSEENLVFALCGSLHYENEKDLSDAAKAPIIFHPKTPSSPTSSGSEEIIILEEKKMTKKQRRKRQQLLQLQKQKQQQQQQSASMSNIAAADVDEELRPLIGMTDSQFEVSSTINMSSSSTALTTDAIKEPLADFDARYSIKAHSSHGSFVPSTSDSEGNMPVTTSEENVYVISNSSPTKFKTKKLEHKINLIAAIEAATSSSTSSAEESGLDFGERDQDVLTMRALTSPTAATPVCSGLQLPPAMASVVGNQPSGGGGTKKKTKRRKR